MELVRHLSYFKVNLFGTCVRLVWNLKDEKGARTNAKRPWFAFYWISNGLCSSLILFQTGSIQALFGFCVSPITFQTSLV
ncbi:hypothetical protein [Leptospira borgpetersenii]|uniref:hypothetical protein n=1 Tax=Leptospira borgpetersenii TaxID=174 RepID=UPI00138F6D08|nr:hypothetical protein [Leptospira borgpetersenii]